MPFIDILLPLLILVPISIYVYFIINRIFNCFYKKIKKRFSILITFLILIPAINVWGFWFLILLHLIIVNLIIELGNTICLKLFNENKRKNWILVYKSFLLPIVVTILFLGYGVWNIQNVHQTNYTITTSKDIRNDGYKIALITDLHFENTINLESIDDYVSEISNQTPDIVILAGDIIDENTSREGMQKVFRSLSKIENKFGIFFIYGNHDHDNYGLLQFGENEMRNAITQVGIQILEDSNTIINEDIVLIGRNDYAYGERLSAMDLYRRVNERKFILLIDHQPVELQINSKVGFDLLLSGHTHDGQVFPSGLLSKILELTEMNYGCKKINNFNIVVSSGMGG